jgi:DNA-binding Lrp family transcriptional regulator
MRKDASGYESRWPFLLNLHGFGYTYREIAAALHCSESTVRNDLQRCHKEGFKTETLPKAAHFHQRLRAYRNLYKEPRLGQELFDVLKMDADIQALHQFTLGIATYQLALQTPQIELPPEFLRVYQAARANYPPDPSPFAKTIFESFLETIQGNFPRTREAAQEKIAQLAASLANRVDIVIETNATDLLPRMREALQGNGLPERDRTILCRHFGVGRTMASLSEIGKDLGGLSAARIHAIEAKALRRVWRIHPDIVRVSNLKAENVRLKRELEFFQQNRQPLVALLDTLIADLELSTRAVNSLQDAGIQYVGQLVQKTESDLFKTKKFGIKGLREIKLLLGEQTPPLHLGMSFPRWTPPPAGK